jgi:hypothetical protein
MVAGDRDASRRGVVGGRGRRRRAAVRSVARWLTEPGVDALARTVRGCAGLAGDLDSLGAELVDLLGAGGFGVFAERAALLGLGSSGVVSRDGGCRLLPCTDGGLASSLALPSDVELIPAWLGVSVGDDRGTRISTRSRVDDARSCWGELAGPPAVLGGGRDPRTRRGAMVWFARCRQRHEAGDWATSTPRTGPSTTPPAARVRASCSPPTRCRSSTPGDIDQRQPRGPSASAHDRSAEFAFVKLRLNPPLYEESAPTSRPSAT